MIDDIFSKDQLVNFNTSANNTLRTSSSNSERLFSPTQGSVEKE